MADIKLSFAPMESITGPVFRRVHKEIYGGVDNYFTPFLVANKNHSFKRRETREFIPYDPNLIPQVLASNPQDFIWAAKVLKEAGYSEVNLNLGCPMPTVVTKKKGSGLLRDLDYLDRYLGEIFEGEDLPNISIKTRTGFENSDNAADIGKIYVKYPFSEVIIHPRAREEYYNGTVDMNAFHKMREQLTCPVCYNGDIRTIQDFERLRNEIPDIHHFMIGRGLLANPALALEIRGKKDKTGTKILCNYLTVLWDEYVKDSLDEKSILFKMKELWYYLEWEYPEAAEEIKEIKKSKTAAEYKVLVKKVLERLGE
ncbi:MAG: tRNA-dihydrouridine synthase family protein [Lachnospiraceae bacterium]|nr:tRNA-dihydrouridine synthase family protein [Lachnospiraceae bacterium]